MRNLLRGMVVGALSFLLAVGVEVALWQGGWLVALLGGFVAGVGGFLAWWLTGRWSLAAVGGFVAASFAPLHEASWVVLVASLVPAVLLVVPWSFKPLQGIVVGAVAGFVVGWVSGSVGLAGVGVVVGVGVVLLRPEVPTRGQVRGVRTAALFGPGAALAGVFVLNAVSGRGRGWLVVEGLGFAVALAGLVVLVGVAGLGLSSLLESTHAWQAGAWNGVALGVAGVVGVMPARVFAWGVEAAALLVVPVAVLVSTCVGRFTTDGPWPNVLGFGIPLVAALSQLLY